MDMGFWQIVSVILLVVFFYVYSLLDGFDLGIGMLLPFLGDKEESHRLKSVIAPVWDGNEVWLVMGAAYLFGAFPLAYARLLSALYLPFTAAIAAFVLRAASIEFSYHDENRPRLWKNLFGGASFAASALGLAAIGFAVQGLPFSGPGILSSSIGDYLSPFPFLFGILGAGAVAWHGIAYAIARMPSPTLSRLALRTWPIVCAVCVMAAVLGIVFVPAVRAKPLVWIGGFVFFLGLACGRAFLFRQSSAFWCSCVSITGVWISVAGAVFPYALPARGYTTLGITFAQAAAPDSSLRVLNSIALVIVPVIIGYMFFVYRVLRKQYTNPLFGAAPDSRELQGPPDREQARGVA